MAIIRCTNKLQKEMGIKAGDPSIEGDDSFPGPWHANLIYINRRKCVVFTNDQTYFSCIAIDVTREEIRNLGDLFCSWLPTILGAEKISPDIVKRILSDYENVIYGKSNSRKILGIMNEQVYNYKYSIEMEGGIHSPMFPEIIKRTNRMLIGGPNYVKPIEELLSQIESLSSHSSHQKNQDGIKDENVEVEPKRKFSNIIDKSELFGQWPFENKKE